VRTRLSICEKKARFASEDEAREAAGRSGLVLLPYHCERCRKFHLTSRTKGKRWRLRPRRSGDSTFDPLPPMLGP
jgi:hypothetical protein